MIILILKYLCSAVYYSTGIIKDSLRNAIGALQEWGYNEG